MGPGARGQDAGDVRSAGCVSKNELEFKLRLVGLSRDDITAIVRSFLARRNPVFEPIICPVCRREVKGELPRFGAHFRHPLTMIVAWALHDEAFISDLGFRQGRFAKFKAFLDLLDTTLL